MLPVNLQGRQLQADVTNLVLRLIEHHNISHLLARKIYQLTRMSNQSLNDYDFEKIRKDLSEVLKNPIATMNLLTTRLTNAEQRRAYREWSKKGDRTMKSNVPIPDKATFVKILRDANFSREQTIWDIYNLLEEPSHTLINLGFHKKRMYRLRPNPKVLVPTASVADDKPSDEQSRKILPGHILGVNKDVEPLWLSQSVPMISGAKRSRRQANFSEESNNSTQSEDGNDANGFAFLQLGNLCYTEEEFWRSGADPEDIPWVDSGYAVVATIEPNHALGDVHILFNFRPKDKIDGERRPIENDEDWGNLPGDSVQRGGARIARSLTQLTNFTIHDSWLLDQNFSHEPEVVRAVRQPITGVILRQKILQQIQAQSLQEAKSHAVS
jgi:hypothetical protein